MVRKGSSVRVRQRALRKPRFAGVFCFLGYATGEKCPSMSPDGRTAWPWERLRSGCRRGMCPGLSGHAGRFGKRSTGSPTAVRFRNGSARRGTLPGMVRTGATFADAAAEWLRYIEHERKARTLRRVCSTTTQVPGPASAASRRRCRSLGVDGLRASFGRPVADSHRREVFERHRRCRGHALIPN